MDAAVAQPTRVLQWSMSFWRGGSLSAVILATDEDWALIQSLEGADVHLGEVNGKHSDVSYEVAPADFVVATDKPEEVALFARVLPDGTGTDIMSYLRDHAAERESEEEGEDEDSE